MLVNFYIPSLWTDMKIAVQKNNLGGQIWYWSLDHSKKRRHTNKLWQKNYFLGAEKSFSLFQTTTIALGGIALYFVWYMWNKQKTDAQARVLHKSHRTPTQCVWSKYNLKYINWKCRTLYKIIVFLYFIQNIKYFPYISWIPTCSLDWKNIY